MRSLGLHSFLDGLHRLQTMQTDRNLRARRFRHEGAEVDASFASPEPCRTAGRVSSYAAMPAP